MAETGGSIFQEQDNNQHKQTFSKTKIGSIKNGKINFPADQKFFHSSDIPTHAKAVNQEIKSAIDPDTLGLKKKPWNTSVFAHDKQQNTEQDLFMIRKGIKDETVVPAKDKFVYAGTDTRNDYTQWQVSVETPIMLHNDKNVAATTQYCREKVAKTNSQILGKKGEYKSPYQQVKE